MKKETVEKATKIIRKIDTAESFLESLRDGNECIFNVVISGTNVANYWPELADECRELCNTRFKARRQELENELEGLKDD